MHICPCRCFTEHTTKHESVLNLPFWMACERTRRLREEGCGRPFEDVVLCEVHVVAAKA